MNLFTEKNINLNFSKKPDKNMRVFLDDSLNKKTEINRKKYFKKQSINYSSLIFSDLIHDNQVKIVNYKDRGKIIKKTDALISNDPNICLSMTAADCLIIYVYDKKEKVVSLIHAGWRGLVKNIIKKTLNKMFLHYKSRPKDILIYISPHIQVCHFEIKENILSKFKKYQKHIKKDDKIKINLSAIAKKQLIELGILNKNIQISSECTYCLNDKYFSYRRSKSKQLKTMIAYLSLKK